MLTGVFADHVNSVNGREGVTTDISITITHTSNLSPFLVLLTVGIIVLIVGLVAAILLLQRRGRLHKMRSEGSLKEMIQATSVHDFTFRCHNENEKNQKSNTPLFYIKIYIYNI